MLSDIDLEKLDAAQQAMDLAKQSIVDLCGAKDPLLAEHALDFLDPLTKMNQKLQRLLTVTKPD